MPTIPVLGKKDQEFKVIHSKVKASLGSLDPISESKSICFFFGGGGVVSLAFNG